MTVQAETSEAQQRFVAFCTTAGVKCVLIELAHGEHAAQPMTATFHHGELPAVLAEIEDLHQRLHVAGFPVVRIKLEAVAANEGVPADATAAQAFPPACYFEFHAKLLLPPESDRALLQRLCELHDAKLSRNARRQRDDGSAERFVTQRAYRVGRVEAFAGFDVFLEQLRSHGFSVLNQQREYTLYDSAATLDAGWIEIPDSLE